MNVFSSKIKINSMVSPRIVFCFLFTTYIYVAKIAQILIPYESGWRPSTLHLYSAYIELFFVISLSTDIVHGKAVQFLLLHEDLSLQYVIPAVSLWCSVWHYEVHFENTRQRELQRTSILVAHDAVEPLNPGLRRWWRRYLVGTHRINSSKLGNSSVTNSAVSLNS